MVCVFVMAAKAPVVLVVKQSVKLHGSFHRQARQQGCIEGEFNSLPTVNLVFLTPMHNQYFSVYTWWMWHKTYNSATNRLVQKVTIIFVNTFMVNRNILRYLTLSWPDFPQLFAVYRKTILLIDQSNHLHSYYI